MTTVNNLLAPAYRIRDDEKAVFRDRWVFEGAEFKHGEETLVAHYPKPEPGDGQPVDVYCTACPARFYRLVVLSSENSVGDFKLGYDLETGSGMGALVHSVASAISEGMLGLVPPGVPA